MSVRRRVLFALATSDRVERVALRVPALRERAHRASLRYVAGVTLDDAVRVTARLAADGLAVSVDLFGENARTDAEAERETEGYVALATRMAALPGTPYVSVDLSHIGLDLGRSRCTARLRVIAERLPTGGRIQVGAEEARRRDAVHAVVLDAAGAGLPVECTLQANLHRTPDDARRLAAAGVGVRLVKGAYVEPSHTALPWGTATDEAYVALAALLAERGADVALATHDPQIRRRALEVSGTRRLEQLLGVREDDARALAREGYDVRLYVPYGARWFRYWSRRVAEARGST